MGELFFALALALIVGAYAVIALMLLWNEAGPWLRKWAAKRGYTSATNPRRPAHARNGTTGRDSGVERPPFHPNL